MATFVSIQTPADLHKKRLSNTDHEVRAIYPHLFALLRFSIGVDKQFDSRLTAEQWQQLYEEAKRQAMRGVLYDGVRRLDASAAPPLPIAMKWARNRETLNGLNELFNSEAARLTELFESRGHHTAILKGQANARLYPDPQSRQPGDIDIWVDGGRQSVEEMLDGLGMMEGADTDQAHHIHLAGSAAKVPVEVHNRPSHGNFNRRTNARLQAWLTAQLEQGTEMCPEGFRTPSLPFAMMMQLSHISVHLLLEGLGMRQVTDYYMLLRSASIEERQLVADNLKRMGLHHVGGALMWVLGETLHLEPKQMLTRPNHRRGKWMLDRIIDGGNFGLQVVPSLHDKHRTSWQSFVEQRRHHWQLMMFNPSESVSFLRFDWDLLVDLVSSIPERIRRRSLRLHGHYYKWVKEREARMVREALDEENKMIVKKRNRKENS